MDCKLPGVSPLKIDPRLHPLWTPPRPKKPRKPRVKRIPMPPATAQHILSQQAAIGILWRTLEVIALALADDDPDYALEVTEEALDQLRRVMVHH